MITKFSFHYFSFNIYYIIIFFFFYSLTLLFPHYTILLLYLLISYFTVLYLLLSYFAILLLYYFYSIIFFSILLFSYTLFSYYILLSLTLRSHSYMEVSQLTSFNHFFYLKNIMLKMHYLFWSNILYFEVFFAKKHLSTICFPQDMAALERSIKNDRHLTPADCIKQCPFTNQFRFKMK